MENKKTEITLAQETVLFGGMLLHYELGASDSRKEKFHISVQKDDEHAEEQVGNDMNYAADCYQKIVSGRVTPCAFPDVMRELRMGQGFFEKGLYKSDIL